jgi:hypothetical protein
MHALQIHDMSADGDSKRPVHDILLFFKIFLKVSRKYKDTIQSTRRTIVRNKLSPCQTKAIPV